MKSFRALMLICAGVLWTTACSGGKTPGGTTGGMQVGAQDAGGDGGAESDAGVTLTVDTSITPLTQLADQGLGVRPVVAVVDSDGVTSSFIEDEVVVNGAASDVAAFAASMGGAVIHDTTPPAPPSGVIGRPGADVTISSVVRLDPSSADLSALADDAQSFGGSGPSKVSSEKGAHLLALTLAQTRAGLSMGPNFVAQLQQADIWTSTTEEADSNGISDAFKWQEFSGIKQCWQYFSALPSYGYMVNIKLALIDGGFWLNSSGQPNVDAHGLSDYPLSVMGYDFMAKSYNAGGQNPNNCSGGSSCPWHGNGSASVATGQVNNGAGAAGTGGMVAVPILLKFDGSDGTAVSAMNTAVAWGADIVSMSFGGDCDWWCRTGRGTNGYTGALNNIHGAGLLAVASAGNDDANSTDNHFWPCQYGQVECVGALNDGANTAKSYSNYGSTVNIWAPTDIHAMPNGQTTPALTVHNGTSASAPFVAGFAAMLKSVNPGLDGDAMRGIINGTASGGGDNEVTAVLNAFAALMQAAGSYRLAPEVTITAPANGGSVNVSPFQGTQFQATALDVMDGQEPSSAFVWTSDVDGNMGTGSTISYDFTSAPEGIRHITATATNSSGVSGSATIVFTVDFTKTTPSPVITYPAAGATVSAGTYMLTGYAPSTDPGGLGDFGCSSLVFNGNLTAQAVPNSQNGLCQAQATLAAGEQTITAQRHGPFR